MSVHSHAVAPESSGAFFHDMDKEICRKQGGGRRNALRASHAVLITDVMVNPADWQVQKKPYGAFFVMLRGSYCCLEFISSI